MDKLNTIKSIAELMARREREKMPLKHGEKYIRNLRLSIVNIRGAYDLMYNLTGNSVSDIRSRLRRQINLTVRDKFDIQ